MGNNKFKNVLIINDYSMFEHTPEGITLKSIFNNWPYDKLMEIYRYSTFKLPRSEPKIKSFRLPPNMLPIDYIVRRLIRRVINEDSSTSTFQISSKERGSDITKMFIKYFSDSVFVCNKNSSLYEAISRFGPQVIYTSGESLFTLKACLFFAREFNIPVVIHFMDNWRETLYPNSGVLKILNLLFNRTLDKVQDRMNNALVISPKMKEAYSLQYPDIKYRVLLNSLPDPLFQPNTQRMDNKTIIFSYVGGLHLNRWESLLDIEKSINELQKHGMKARLFIYTPQKDSCQFSHKFDANITVFKGYLPHDQIGIAYEDADILVHTESFEQQVIEYTKYSLSTKIPEYMATGKPILCYAPRLLAVSEYINNARAGIVVDNYDDLVRAVYDLVSNQEMRIELGQNGVKMVRDHHTHDKACEILLESLQ